MKTLTNLQKKSLIYIKEGGKAWPKNHANNIHNLVNKGFLTQKYDRAALKTLSTLTDKGNSLYFQL
tara:strand:+ start:7754 stop:7951 length:198 start_codon:yes stop_codon:yes gene_type:complete